MLNRYVSLAACLSLSASISVIGQSNQGAGYVFELPGPNSAGSNLQGFIYNGNFQGPDIPNVSGPIGARQIIAKPDGSKFYVVGANAGGLESVGPTSPAFRPSMESPELSAQLPSRRMEAAFWLAPAQPADHPRTHLPFMF